MVWNIGFDDGLGVTYALTEMDGNLRKIEYEDATRERATNGGGFEPGDLNLGRRIKPDSVPAKFLWEGPRNRKLPDAKFSRGMLLVSDRLKNIIEEFEPGRHQFFPIDVLFKSGELAKKMHFLNICTRLDSVDRELTTSKLDYSIWRPDLGGQLVFNLDQVGKHHLWHDRHIHNGTYASDKLHDAIRSQQISGLVFSKRMTNVEWK
jgi:hypothetical protein